MVDVFPDIVQIIMLSSGADTLLAVARTDQLGHVAIWSDGAQKDGFKLNIG